VPGGENTLLKPDGSLRYFTVRESARLQTFPDDFILHGAWTEAMRQLGNAVPVLLVETVANGIRQSVKRDAIIAGWQHHTTRSIRVTSVSVCARHC
jgi:DNA (cytosine-5)-methyltransferase 1